MDVPIANLLKRHAQAEMALFQDVVVGLLYQTDNKIVLHGGTAVWRCFHGNRFSDDVDAYVSTKTDLNRLRDGISLAAAGREVKVEKVKDTGNLLFMGLSLGNAYMKVELNHTREHLPVAPREYERADGTRMEVLTLPPEELVLEKIMAYSDRRFIRDLYDIYVLSDQVDKKKVRKEVLGFIDGIRPPVNEDELANLIYVGVAPAFKGMVESIRGRFR